MVLSFYYQMSVCIVFVCNNNFIYKFIDSYNQLINNGKYKGDVCLIIGNDLNNSPIINEIKAKTPIIIKYFPDIVFSDYFYEINGNIEGSNDKRHLTKRFQWHKLYVFDNYFKNWEFILYMDTGMYIYNDISHIIAEKEENKIIAHSDAYPSYVWKLKGQFDLKNEEIFKDLDNSFNLNIDYFQTGMMLFDTKIIEEDTFQNLISLANKYPISKTNEQGIISLYFIEIKKLWKALRINNDKFHLYDYDKRNKNVDYIMTKYLQ